MRSHGVHSWIVARSVVVDAPADAGTFRMCQRVRERRTMFRVKASEIHTRIPKSAAIVLATLVAGIDSEPGRRVSGSRRVSLAGCLAGRLRAGIGGGDPLFAARRRHADHRPVDRPGGPRALHGRDAVASATPVRHQAHAQPDQALRARHSGQHGRGGDHDRSERHDHERQLGRDRHPGGRVGLCRPARWHRSPRPASLWRRWPARSPSATRRSGTGILRWTTVDACAGFARMHTCSRLPEGVHSAACFCCAM